MAIIRLIILILAVTGSSVAFTQATDEEVAAQSDLVEVNYSSDIYSPYKDRKSDFALTFSLNVEQVYPSSFRSKIDGNVYETLFGTSSIEIYQGKIGMKYNTSLGGLEAGFLGGYGQIQDGRIALITLTDTDSNLEITKMGAYGSLVVDTIFSEPYVAPYIEGQLYSYDWLESAKSGESESGVTELSYGFSVGALFQLNWLDPRSAFTAREDYGLDNTYLDLFVSYYSAAGSEDPDFSSELNYGFGLKLEF
jgi:hypothetical protein